MSWLSNFFGGKQQDYQALVNSDKNITVKAGENLLAAGLDAGLPWPHDCRVGSCGTCRCYLRKGNIKPLADFSYVLDGQQLKDGMILACQSQLRSDVEIEVAMEDGAQPVERMTCPAEITATKNLTHDIIQMTLKCDKKLPKSALAGQYAEVEHKDFDKPRSYSFARDPANEKNNELNFFVRHVPGGEFTDWLFNGDRAGEKLELSAPYGNFWLRNDSAPMICLAGGSGISAVKAILEYAANQKVKRDAYFLFGARAQKDLYCREEMAAVGKQWNASHTFEFTEVLSEEPEDSDWKGPRGYVTHCLKEKYFDNNKLSPVDAQAYLCGPPPMIDSAIEMLVGMGMLQSNIFYDKFLDASSIPGGR